MDKEIEKQERTLEKLEIEDAVEERRLSIKQKKALGRQLEREGGKGILKEILGAVKGVKFNREEVQTLHSQGYELRELSRPKLRRLR